MSLVFSPVKVVAESFLSMMDPRASNPSFQLHGDDQTEKLLLVERRKVEDAAALDRDEINGYNSFRVSVEEDDDGSSETSSIGALSSSSDDDEENGDVVQSKLKDEGILASLDSLEESLPIKRGLSNFFTGKSKSFATLSDAGGGHAKDLVKHENPFNKRRRILMSYKASWRRRASCTSLITSFPPLLSPELIKEQSDEEEGDDPEEHENCFPLVSLPSLRSSSFKNPRSLSLSDLQKI
ncbi:hypothetical protein KSP39_PZI021015 [Platanthera zijinensis]|uniref:Uncharacterized protein n=1 Tax=Platanthera zijinensis TaxID=2320716 RepID=A0AAP0FVK3_9ASPA